MYLLLRIALIILMVIGLFSPCAAEELEPRRWTHLPINTNFMGAAYAYTEADISLDPVLKLEDVQMEMHTWAAKYIRTFSLFDKTTRVSFLQAYQDGEWTGLLNGQPAKAKRQGLTDSVLRFAVNLYGAPPLQGEDYRAYRGTQTTETIVGAGLSVQLPTGEYMDDKLINLGSNRFTFRPQVGVMHTRGKWSAEATGIVALFSDNDEFFNGKKLEQDPLYTLNSHLIYTLRPGFWAGLSGGYNYGGRSTIDGIRKDDRKQFVAWALSFGCPITRQFGAKLAYIGTRTRESSGMDSDTVAVGLSAFW